MRTVIFVGPTLDRESVQRALPEAEVRGPVACGDLLRLEPAPGLTLGIIDGLFEHSLPVWHKEILWCLSRGCRVYGGGSMGALRAAELAAFGMVGVGRIFGWYRDGVLEDDDEVAIAHEDAATGYRVRSDAMVNVRATLERAVHEGMTDEASASALLGAVKATPYFQRDLRRALQASSMASAERARLGDWLDAVGLVDQKAADARELLVRIGQEAGTPGEPPRFAFSYTEVFAELMRTVNASSPEGPATTLVPREDLLEELRLRGLESYESCWRAARERASGGAPATWRGARDPGPQQLLSALRDVLHERGLLEGLAARAERKSRLLASSELPVVRVAPAALLAWHFARLERPVPDDVDAYARALDLDDQKALVLVLARERWFLERTSEA